MLFIVSNHHCDIPPTTTTATFNGTYFQDFGIHPITLALYGKKKSDIITVTISVDEDQNTPPAEPNSNKIDYWGFYDAEEKLINPRLIWQKWFLLDMCFPCGVKAEEELNRGKAYRLNIKQI